jgi:hypothetical protein
MFLYGHGLSSGPGLTCKVCPPANRCSPNVAKSVLVFAFGSAMLRVRVPILGTMPREQFWR